MSIEWREIKNDNVLRNDHKIKTTQQISTISVSFFSEDNVLSDEEIDAIFFFIKVMKIKHSAVFWDTQYI